MGNDLKSRKRVQESTGLHTKDFLSVCGIKPGVEQEKANETTRWSGHDQPDPLKEQAKESMKEARELLLKGSMLQGKLFWNFEETCRRRL